MATTLPVCSHAQANGADRQLDKAQASLPQAQAMQTGNRHFKMAKEMQNRRNLMLANRKAARAGGV